MHSTREHGSQGIPKESDRAEHRTENNSEYGTRAGNVQELDKKSLVTRHRDIVHPVVQALCRSRVESSKLTIFCIYFPYKKYPTTQNAKQEIKVIIKCHQVKTAQSYYFFGIILPYVSM